jgi:hypothetical protein
MRKNVKTKNHIDFIENESITERSGIYLLRDEKSGMVYIGNSSNVRARVAVHRSLLQSKKHNNSRLQKIYNEGVLTVCVLIEFPYVDKIRLKEAERLFIDASPVLFPSGICNRSTRNIRFEKNVG